MALFFKNKKKNLKIRKYLKGGRNFLGKVVNRTVGKSYTKKFFYKFYFNKQIVTLPTTIRSFKYRYFKTPMVKGLLSGNSEIYLPVNKFVYVGWLFYKNNNNNVFNTIEGFGFGKKIYWVGNDYSRIASTLGSWCKIIYNFGQSFVLSMPSGYIGIFNSNLLALNYDYFNKSLSKNLKGYKKTILRGKRSIVRGVAKNPNDHPHGGRSNSVLLPMTPWNKIVNKQRNTKAKNFKKYLY